MRRFPRLRTSKPAPDTFPTPAVAYDVGGIAEPVRRFDAGVVVAPGDVEALADALRRVLDDPAPFRAGAQRAREELTWDAAARAHLDLYAELV